MIVNYTRYFGSFFAENKLLFTSYLLQFVTYKLPNV